MTVLVDLKLNKNPKGQCCVDFYFVYTLLFVCRTEQTARGLY